MGKIKKELVIITTICWPISSAPGNIALNCAKYLDSDYNIRVIALQSGKNAMNGEKYRNVKLYTLTQWRLRWSQIMQESVERSSGAKKIICGCAYFLLRAFGRIQSLIFILDNCWWFQKKAYKKLEELNSNKKIDTIISINAPIEAHIAADKFKLSHSEVKWISYWVDLFASKNYKLNLFITMNQMKKLEERLISHSDFVLTTEEIFNVFAKRIPHSLQYKIKAIPYTLRDHIIEKDYYKEIDDSGSVHFACIGSFYRKIRNPEYMLKLFASAYNDKYFLHLYTRGECQDIVDKYVSQGRGKIKYHGIVGAEELQTVLSQTHVLINIENTLEECNPSKLLELVSYRKPILDFCYNEQPNPILSKYPLCLRIKNSDDLETVMCELDTFLRYNCKGKKITKEYIYQYFAEHLETSVGKQIVDVVNNL